MPAFGNGNIIGAGLTSTKIKFFSGFSTTLNSSMQPAGTLQNYSADSTPNSYVADNVANPKERRFSGFTTTLKTSFTDNGGSPRGITTDDGTKFYDVAASTKIHKHTSFTSTITDSIVDGRVGSNIWDVSLDTSKNTIFVDFGNTKAVKFSAFTTTVKTSFSLSATTSPRGMSQDGTNTIVSDGSAGTQSYKKYSAFTSTIKTSFNPSDTQHGSEWDKTADRFPAAGGGAVVINRPMLLLMNAG